MTVARPAFAGGTQVLTSVTNAARLLREFGRGEPQLGVSELARRLGIAKSSAHRIVHTLAKEGLLERVEETGAYRLSVTMQILGASAQATSGLHGAATAALVRGSLPRDLQLRELGEFRLKDLEVPERLAQLVGLQRVHRPVRRELGQAVGRPHARRAGGKDGLGVHRRRAG